jgi:hypothetical protein
MTTNHFPWLAAAMGAAVFLAAVLASAETTIERRPLNDQSVTTDHSAAQRTAGRPTFRFGNYQPTRDQATVEQVRWGRRYYGGYGNVYRGGYYYPGPRYYSGYRGVYGPYDGGYYGGPYYGRGGYYYGPRYPYSARVGPVRVFWR